MQEPYIMAPGKWQLACTRRFKWWIMTKEMKLTVESPLIVTTALAMWPLLLSSHCVMLHVVGACSLNFFKFTTGFSLLYFYLQLIFQMPQSHRNVFTYISAFLRELLLHSNDNKLDAKTLGKLYHFHFQCYHSQWPEWLGRTEKETNRATRLHARTHSRLFARTYSLARINSLVHSLENRRHSRCYS